FFIPIITPTAVRSSYCKFEFESFLAREKELDRNNLIFPILYIPVPALMGDRWRQDPLLSIIHSRQYEDLQSLRHLDASSSEAVPLRVQALCANICKALEQPWLSPEERRETEARQQAEEERRRQEKLQEEARQQAEEERRRQEKLQEEARQQAEEERRRQEKLQEEARQQAEEERRRQEKLQEKARQQAEEEHRREEDQTKRRLDEAEADKCRQDKERRKLEKTAAWAAKKERLHRWRGAAGAVVVALLMVGGIWLYRTTTPAGVTSAVVQPNPPRADKAKAAADSEAQRKEAEQQRLAAAKADEERKAKAAADAEAQRQAEEAQRQRLAAPKADEGRKAKAAVEAEARAKAEQEKDRLAALRAEQERRAKAAAEAEAKRYAALVIQGNAVANTGDYDRAIATFNEVIRLDPNNALAFGSRGLAYWKKGDNDRAMADYNEAIRLNPNNPLALGNRGNA